MKKTIRFFFLLLITALVSSCSKSFYQFPIFTSENTTVGKLDELVVEKNQFEVGFSFYGHDTPLQIRVLNKSNNEIEIDWRNAYVNINGTVYQMYSEMSKTWICSPEFNQVFKNAPDSIAISDFEKIVVDHGKKSFGDFVSRISSNQTLIFNSLELQKDTVDLSKSKVQSPINDFLIYRFDKDNSPIHVSISLPISLQGDTTTIVDDFWVSDVYRINQKQFDTPYLHKKSMNMSTLYTYSEKRILLSSAYYIATGVVGTVAIWMSRGASFDPDEIEN